MRLEFSRRAEVDLEDIQDFSVKTFGVLVALRYMDDLRACCFMLRDQPELGTEIKYEDMTYRRFHKAKHVLIYKISKDVVTVARVLHQSQQLHV